MIPAMVLVPGNMRVLLHDDLSQAYARLYSAESNLLKLES